MRLVLIRHGKSEERDPERWPDDALRPLTPKGLSESRQTGTRLAEWDLGCTDLWSSPLVRARQTAEGLQEGDPTLPPVTLTHLLGMDFSIPALLAALRELPPDATPWLVGHEPDLSLLAARLIGAPPMALLVKKGAVLVMDFPGALQERSGTLTALIPPKWLLAGE